jgi:hypothetical protein
MMVGIFVAFAREDAACAEEIRRGLEAKGYAVWREQEGLSIESILYPRTVENGIVGSAAVIVLWSSHAAQSEEVEREMLFAQRLRKLALPVPLDATELPDTLVAVSSVPVQASCAEAVTQLLPLLPSPQSDDPLIAMIEKAAKSSLISMRARFAAIDEAAQMLRRGEHREEVLALLEYLIANDAIERVRDRARDVLKVEVDRAGPSATGGLSRHSIEVVCKKCGKLNYFNKYRVCGNEQFVRASRQRGGTDICQLDLTCEQCGEDLKVTIDCGGYR